MSAYQDRLDGLWSRVTAPRQAGSPTVASTFAGMGGSLMGYLGAGYAELLAVERDRHAAECLRLNFPVRVHQGDIADVRPGDLGVAPGELTLLDGSPPCQGFSSLGLTAASDPRSKLFREFVRLLEAWRPRTFVFENVPGLVERFPKTFATVCAALIDAGYRILPTIVQGYAFGAATIRHRLIITGARDDLGADPGMPGPTVRRAPTLREALAGLPGPVIEAPLIGPRLRGLAVLVAPGGHGGQVLSSRGGREAYYSLKRMTWDQPAKAIPAQFDNGRSGFLHPSQQRYLSAGELMRIQGIPDGYRWPDGTTYKLAHKRIGNSVCPLLTEALGEHLRAVAYPAVPGGA